MSDEQFQKLREDKLTMIRTLFDGSLVVRDQAGDVWEMGAAGDLLPHVPRETNRVSLADLPVED